MDYAYEEDRAFKGTDFTLLPLEKGEYAYCTFINCNFASTDLSGFKFLDCDFIGCDLNLVQLHKTLFQNVSFKECKMLGLRFDHCQSIGMSFNVSHCILNHSSFYKTSLKGINLYHTSLLDVDFTESELPEAVFYSCDLLNALFDRTNLEKADLRTSYNFRIAPESNRLHKAKFSLSSITGLLQHHNIYIDQKS